MAALLIDLGNSRLKWRLIRGEGREEGAFPLARAEGFLKGLVCRAPQLSLWLASVAGSRRGQRIAERLLMLPFARAERVVVRPLAAGPKLGYRDPSELGVDRWLALLAAREHAPCAIALAGTCLTLDALDREGRHWPGWILPGGALLEHALTARAPRLRPPRPEERSAQGPFPQSTGEAIALGSDNGLVAAIERFRALLEERWGHRPALLLSGGDGARLAKALAPPLMLRPELVLDGLERLARGCAGR